MLLATLLFLSSPYSAHAHEQATVIVRANRARPAIERILRADNLSVDLLPPAEVAARMEQIDQGGAPDHFWAAYQIHVRAWRAYASALARSRRADPRDPDRQAAMAVAEARIAINTSFARVEKIARHYKARIPVLTSAR